MAYRGEWFIESSVESRKVDSRPRRHCVTFSPSSSRSRLHVVDSGLRYEVRLTEGGIVQLKLEGGGWSDIDAGVDPVTGEQLPWGLSYSEKSGGEELGPVRFDMVAAGRGRLLAKETGTDRLFHLKLDDLFRTRRVSGEGVAGGELSAVDPGRAEDPPVPSTHLKLDPGFFWSEAPPGLVGPGVFPGPTPSAFPLPELPLPPIPPELGLDYSNHPAALRFPLFKMMMRTGAVDAICVPVKRRVWYLIDSRSPLQVIDLNDLEALTDEDLKTVATKVRIKRVLKEAARDFASDFEKDVARNAGKLLLGLAADELEDAGEELAENLVEWMLDEVSQWFRRNIKEHGFGALILPLNAVLLLKLKQIFKKSYKVSFVRDPSDVLPRAVVEVIDAPVKIGDDKRPQIHLTKLLDVLLRDRNMKLGLLISDLLRAGRRRRMEREGRPDSHIDIANVPPQGFPTYAHVVYANVLDRARREERRSVEFDRVMDLGVGYSHWHEHWQTAYGGEMHSLLGLNPVAQKEGYNSIQYRLLNGPVIDGDGYNDGTTNFYMLVRLAGEKAAGAGTSQRYAILWIDEQTYFTQRWRLLHPTKDVEGDLFSLSRTLANRPDWFRFDLSRYWCPFEHDCVDDASRMAVVRQIVAVTGRDPKLRRPEIYTICYSYGVCDHTWRWRRFPEGVTTANVAPKEVGKENPGLPKTDGPSVFVNTLGLREDGTLHLRGTAGRGLPGGKLTKGRWIQKYLPADARHVPRSFQLEPNRKPARGFDHEWDFVSEGAYQCADRFHLFGVYEEHVDARSQYYTVDVLDKPKRETELTIGQRVWRNDASGGLPPLRTDTYNYNWTLGRDPDSYLHFDDMYDDRLRAPTMSMYEPTTRFRLLYRKPLGWIAAFYDKRDDELQPASHLPHETTLVADDAPVLDPFRGRELHPPLRGFSPRGVKLRVLVKGSRRVLHHPIVRKVQVTRVRAGGRTRHLRVAFWTPQSVDQVHENIWRVRVGAFGADGGVETLLDVECFDGFARRGVPSQPLPLDYDAEVLSDEYRYDHQTAELDDATAAKMDLYCTPRGRVDHATSVWFEDVVGHKSTAQAIEFVEESDEDDG